LNRIPTIFGKKKENMKRSAISKGLLLGLALLLATCAFAANKGSVTIPETMVVNGQKLAAGDYKVSWDGAGPNVELSLLRGKNVIAKVPAQMLDLNAPASTNMAISRKNDDGTRTLTELRFSGKKYSFALGAEQASAASGVTK
jgi:hypothetical protein